MDSPATGTAPAGVGRVDRPCFARENGARNAKSASLTSQRGQSSRRRIKRAAALVAVVNPSCVVAGARYARSRERSDLGSERAALEALPGRAAVKRLRSERGELAPHRPLLQHRVIREAAVIRRVRLAQNQWREVAAARFGNAETFGVDELARHHPLPVRNLIERRLAVPLENRRSAARSSCE